MLAPILNLALVALALVDPPVVEIVTRSYDISTIAPSRPTEVPSILVTPMLPTNDTFGGEVTEPSIVDPQEIVELVRRSVRPDEWETPGRSIELMGENGRVLVVAAPDVVQQDVRRCLDFLASALATPIVVKVDVYRVEDGASAAPAGAKPERSFRATLQSGIATALRSETVVPFVRDFDVEIAEGAARHLEVLDRYPVGTIAELAAYRGSDDSVLVEFIVRHTWEREGLTELPLDLHHMIRTDNAVNEVAGGGTLERPHLGFATLAGSARLTEGKSTHAFAACRPGGDGVLVNVTLEKAAAPPREFECGDRTLRLVDLAGNLAHGFRTPRQEEWRLDRTLASLDSPIEFVLPPLRLNGFEPAMTDSINSAMSAYADVSSGDTERGPVDVTLVAHWLACSGAKAAADAAMSSTLARMWSNADRATVALDVVDRAGGHLVRLPAAVGDGFTLAGSQSTYIVAYEVDVANNASTTDPIVRALVDGTAVWTRGGAITGSAHHRIQVRSSLLDGDPHRLVGRVRGNGPLDEPRFVTSWIDAALDVATKRDGSAAELGTLSLPENVQGTLTLVPSSSE